jgi:hypothetical protein
MAYLQGLLAVACGFCWTRTFGKNLARPDGVKVKESLPDGLRVAETVTQEEVHHLWFEPFTKKFQCYFKQLAEHLSHS